MENSALRRTCEKLNLTPIEISLDSVFKDFNSSLLGGRIPEGRYSENMKSTVVSFRNGIMISIAAGLADSLDFDTISLGVDFEGADFLYPDCRPEFIRSMAEAVDIGTNGKVELVVPFVNKTKKQLVELGQKLNVDFNDTYSCYNGREKHCGRCGTCIERKEAFKLAGINDPTEYES